MAFFTLSPSLSFHSLSLSLSFHLSLFIFLSHSYTVPSLTVRQYVLSWWSFHLPDTLAALGIPCGMPALPIMSLFMPASSTTPSNSSVSLCVVFNLKCACVCLCVCLACLFAGVCFAKQSVCVCRLLSVSSHDQSVLFILSDFCTSHRRRLA